MEDYERIIVNLEHTEDEDIAAGLRRISSQLPIEVRLHLANLLSQFRRTGGREHLFKQMHGKSVGELLKVPVVDQKPILQGNVSGMKFTLIDKPGDDKERENSRPS